MQGFFSDKPEASIKLNELRKTVETYNEENAARSNHNIQPVPVKSTVLDMSEERITGALNGIIQIQMCVLQNERELISLK